MRPCRSVRDAIGESRGQIRRRSPPATSFTCRDDCAACYEGRLSLSMIIGGGRVSRGASFPARNVTLVILLQSRPSATLVHGSLLYVGSHKLTAILRHFSLQAQTPAFPGNPRFSWREHISFSGGCTLTMSPTARGYRRNLAVQTPCWKTDDIQG